MAKAFSRLAGLDGADRVIAAIHAHPELIGGVGSLDTDFMRVRPSWVAKGGAEGLFCAVSATGTGIALKCEDGNSRPLRAALALFIGEDLGTSVVENSRGEVVGEMVAA
jgi:L-asparaginase II